jgi:hypothetical protein
MLSPPVSMPSMLCPEVRHVGRGLLLLLPVALPEGYQRTVDDDRSALGEVAFAAAWEAGQAMPPEECVNFALEEIADG